MVRVPDDPVKRRRLAVLASAAVVAAVGGAAVGAGADDRDAERSSSSAAETIVADAGAGGSSAGRDEGRRLPLETVMREAGATIVMRFDGTSAPGYVLRALRDRRAAGVILFRDNIASPGQLRALTRSIRRASRGRALIMVDQEGGTVRRIPWAAPRSAPPRIRSVGAARDVARETARDLLADGVNVNLAPVADVGTWPGSVMRPRAFPGGGEAVGELVAATVRAYADEGLLATVKHFPGLGRSEANTDFRPATIAGRGDLEPFRAAIEAGVPLVMASHALHPELDPRRIASQSRPILVGLLREELGFEGACITDSLEAKAVVRRSSTATAGLRSMRAGCDLLLTTGKGSYLAVLRALVAEVRRDPSFRDRLAEARSRIEALRG